ncbi:hypothetical protein ACHHYP_07608 [Achlya hypogyna]|uniref:Anaphase-promoting complex subunit 4 WD40 domain-containing protein n=1 Tax=Achlya hypogyna TaxID=1202772 RepID=A0A1V9ZLN3_ACHHY|nr:hypothetical protein ACHHYP_07608 [Achlya hypogyna]
MEVRRVALPRPCAPYCSWNSSIQRVPGEQSRDFSLVCEDGSVKVLRWEQDCCALEVTQALGTVGIGRFALAWSADGAFVAVAHEETIRIYDRDWSLLFAQPLPYYAKHVALTSSIVAVGTSNGAYIYTWCRDSPMQQIDLVYPQTPVSYCCASPCGQWLALGATDGRVQLRRLPDRTIALEVLLPSTRVTSVAFKDTRVVFAVKDGHVAVYEFSASGWRATYPPLRCHATPAPNHFLGYPSSTLVAFYGSLDFVAVLHSSQFIDVIDIESGRAVDRVVFPASVMLMGLAYSPSTGLVAHDVSGACFLVSWRHGNALLPPRNASEAEYAANGLTLRQAAVSGTIEIVDDATGAIVAAPFLPPTTLRDLNTKVDKLRTFCLQRDGAGLVVGYGHTIFRHAAGRWEHWLAPRGVVSMHVHAGHVYVHNRENHSICILDLAVMECIAVIASDQDPKMPLQLRVHGAEDGVELQLAENTASSSVLWSCAHPRQDTSC